MQTHKSGSERNGDEVIQSEWNILPHTGQHSSSLSTALCFFLLIPFICVVGLIFPALSLFLWRPGAVIRILFHSLWNMRELSPFHYQGRLTQRETSLPPFIWAFEWVQTHSSIFWQMSNGYSRWGHQAAQTRASLSLQKLLSLSLKCACSSC